MTTKTKGVKTQSTETTTRKVTVWSTQERSTQTIETSAKTWGELKNELSNVGNTRAVIRETRNTLESGQAELPNQDFTLFLYPEKVRSGRTVKVRKVKGADWDNTVDTLVVEKVKEYTKEFDEIMEGFAPGKAKKLSKEDTKLAEEAAELAAELDI
jgi:hypothetical protein